MRPTGHRRSLSEMLEGYVQGAALLARQDYDVLEVIEG